MKENTWKRSLLWGALFAEKMDTWERQQKFITSVLEAEWHKGQVIIGPSLYAQSTTGREDMARSDSTRRQSRLNIGTAQRNNYWTGWGASSVKMPKSVCLVNLEGVI